jgi:tetratricopeptide (TPR) repeat protein
MNEGRVLRFPQRGITSEEIEGSTEQILAIPLGERVARAQQLRLEEPDVLLSLGARLRDRLDTAPAMVRDEAEFLYRFLQTPERPIGLFDERDYFLGEFALLAATACRQLSRREEARLWFDRSEAGFRHTMNAVADLSRLAYQRLALRMEERHLDAVLELAPSLVQSFQKLLMPQEEIKARFLEGLALMESERLNEAVEVFRKISVDAESLGSEKLQASAYGNLTHLYGMRGDAALAIEASRHAIPVLKRLNDRVALAKVQWGIATLLRETGQIAASIEAYRAAQTDFDTIGMRADVAALHLVVADLLLELGQEAAAATSVLAALPVIQELNMVPEGMAALQLLKQSLRDQKLDRPALRELHGYFEELR